MNVCERERNREHMCVRESVCVYEREGDGGGGGGEGGGEGQSSSYSSSDLLRCLRLYIRLYMYYVSDTFDRGLKLWHGI